MVKIVNVYPKHPVTSTNPPIRTRVNRVHMDSKDIRKCLIAGAVVEEVLGDTKIRLNFNNYDKLNQPNADYNHPHTEAFKEKVEAKKEENKPVEVDTKEEVKKDVETTDNKPHVVTNNSKKIVRPNNNNNNK